MLRQAIVVGALLVMVSAVPVQAVLLEKIEVTMAFGGDTVFDAQDPAAASQLTWQNGSAAMVWKDTGAMFTASDCDISGSFSSMTDNSAGEIASARFASGSWGVVLYDYIGGLLANNFEVLSVGGSVDWYNESETGSDELTGVGIVTMDSIWLDPGHAFFSGPLEWGSGPDGKSGISAQTSFLSLDPADYATDFTGDSLTLVIFADSSYIPEPATMILLALGGLAGLRRRRR